MGPAEPTPGIVIADAAPEHLEAIAAIYGASVLDSAVTFDTEPLGIDHWSAVLADRDQAAGRLLLVALDGSGSVLGFAKSGAFMGKPAYSTTCETSVYVAEAARGKGVATTLYSALFERLDASPLRLAVAGLAEPNPASEALHRAFGFEPVGTFRAVGVKFGRPWDVTWYQRPLG